MSLQRSIYLDDDLAKIVVNDKLPLSWFVNQALREFLQKFDKYREVLNK